MTNYSVVLSGPAGTYNITGKTRSSRLSRSLGSESATLDLDCFNLTNNHAMDAVTLTVDGVVRFRGRVKSQSDSQDQTVKRSSLRCVDDTDKLQRKLVAQVYQNLTVKQVITSMRASYAPWLDVTLVQDIGGPIELVRFEYDTLADAIGKLAELTGAYWYLDVDNKLHFFADSDGVASIKYDATKNIRANTFTLDTTADDLANRVWIVGAKSASATYTEQYWTGDGNNSVFTLAYEPNYPEVYEGGIAKTIEVDKGGVSDKDYTYDKKNKVLKRTAGALPVNVQLRFRYRPTVQVIDYFEDPGSVATYGLYEKAIRDKKIADKAAARKRGRAALKRTKALRRIASWETRDWQVAPGQLIDVSAPPDFVTKCRVTTATVDFRSGDILASIEAEEVAT